MFCLLLSVVALGAARAETPTSAKASESRPNIIFILADDLGFRELGCYGQEKIKTPRIDQLAGEGMLFTRAYSGNAVCAPSRCVLMTGKHPGHAIVRNNKGMKPEGQHPISSDHINDEALEFIKKNKDRSFFLYYPSLIPHVALHVPDEDLKPYLEQNWNDPPFTREGGYGYTPHFTPRAAYAAMITKLDTYVGKVLDLIDELGLTDNTIVIFSSDNGTTHLKDEVDYDFFASVGELRGLKGELWEGGIRVPQIVKWPGKIEAGSVTDHVTGFEDWLPTLLDLVSAETEAPDDADGVSIASTLLGDGQEERNFLYREFQGYGGQQSVWLGNKWKGIRTDILKKGNESPLKIELFDLESDPSESKDVAAANPEVVSEIKSLMSTQRTVSEVFSMGPLDEATN